MNMTNQQKIVVCLIIFFLIFTIIIMSLLININKKSKNTDNTEMLNTVTEDNTIVAEDEEYYYPDNEFKAEYNKTLEYEKVKTNYIMIENLVKNYIYLIGERDNETLINLMAPDYVREFNKTRDNILSNTNIPQLKNTSQVYYLEIENMLVAPISDQIYLYIVQGQGSIKYTNETFNINIMIELDTQNCLYNIYPQEYLENKKILNAKAGNILKYNTKEINDRGVNHFNYINKVTEQEIANKLFDNYKYNLIYDRQEAYIKLNKSYANKKFGSQLEFNAYLDNLANIINNIRINKYKVYTTNEYTDYICTDQYNNYYIFRQQGGIMRYTVFLDSYTVELDAFKANYEDANDDTRVAMQIEKINQMLNMKDYNAIYNKLNTTFKNNNFKNVYDLKDYLQKNFYDINLIELNEYQQKEDYYVCECILKNSKNDSEKKNLNIIIKLIDSNNFEMSFSIN